jgi:hypothetical protein
MAAGRSAGCAGTENVASIAALGAAAGLAEADLASGSAARLAVLRDRLHHALVAALPGRVELNGMPGRRLPGMLIGLDENRAMAAIRLSAGRWTSGPRSTPQPASSRRPRSG